LRWRLRHRRKIVESFLLGEKDVVWPVLTWFGEKDVVWPHRRKRRGLARFDNENKADP